MSILKTIKKDKLSAILIGIGLILCVILINSTNNDLEKSKERMTVECNNQGKVIATFYTNSGDKYYGCKEESKHEQTPNSNTNR